MIFVTVGTHNRGFERLIQKMDEIAGKTNEEVIMQIGASNYVPKNAKCFNFAESSELMVEYLKHARVVVAHAGAGTILDAFLYEKPLVVVPRQKKHNEVIDDQQSEIAGILSAQNRITAVFEIDHLEDILSRSGDIIMPRKLSQNHSLVGYLKSNLLEKKK